jgi:hypothetical protein
MCKTPKCGDFLIFKVPIDVRRPRDSKQHHEATRGCTQPKIQEWCYLKKEHTLLQSPDSIVRNSRILSLDNESEPYTVLLAQSFFGPGVVSRGFASRFFGRLPCLTPPDQITISRANILA